MLEKVNLEKKINKETYKKEITHLQEELSVLQQKLKEAGLPVIILFDGWGAAGKGSLISRLIQNFDPRGFKVYSNDTPEEFEKRRPLLWRYWQEIPARGQISVLDRSWYQDVSISRIEENLSREEVLRRINSIKIMERQLTDDGYLVLKFFLHISQKEQKARFDKLDEDKDTEWRVTERDRRRNREYDKYFQAFDEMIGYTDTPNAPWHILACHDKYAARLDLFHIVRNAIRDALARREKERPAPSPEIIMPKTFNLVSMPQLSEIPLDKTLDKEKYRKQLDHLQQQLSDLHNRIYRKKVPVVIGYEGWDAAGKGGNIKRVAAALDPRGYEVNPVSAPTKEELAHQYLWRFWRNLPKTGHIAIFDRTWYGRVMVERIEGFCTEDDWHRAYREINEFEQELYDWGAVVIKFWLHIDKDEQLARFNDRQNTPEKRWKITDEDWRNREKWPQYEEAVNDMLRYTSTDFAPWHIIESQDKRYGRIKALKIIISEIEKRL
ncbi:MAG TPA: polyphosphate:AMP phosphotransferase [Candidatus Gallacutalibacter pullicola]|uniref:Polyphosphate:AMP phosphotransferase n=1 Tax=Candidatus Gallacutalibacter pullicola TaxID=2840830 RepID=A0A9D1J1H3_9FIRM|nr:polyphosphate:AMP phosphotransferase [Candidatus Gallacutalibacter pullicola]